MDATEFVNGCDGSAEEVEPFRNLCSHYNRACSLVVRERKRKNLVLKYNPQVNLLHSIFAI